eukprot:TRINITY_DN41779_c0_g1_i1.p1 TRINITY_DN41779_c0_g1~~TRINITY_DN41779_c0_g1_i1.p1  ORF type:complete len:983 (+),score=131.66 TRINITY_DN41779_c0_g1_i1:396-2951(+)
MKEAQKTLRERTVEVYINSFDADIQKDLDNESVGNWSSPVKYHIYNLTNLPEVMSGQRKPKFELVTIKLVSRKARWNVTLHDKKEKVSYHEWSQNKVVPEDEDLFNNGRIVQVNQNFWGGVAVVGSESMLNVFFAVEAFKGLRDALLGNVGKQLFQFGSVPIYLGGIIATLAAPPLNLPAAAVAMQWGGQGSISPSLYNSTGIDLLKGFEITQYPMASRLLIGSGGKLVTEHILKLWDRSWQYNLLTNTLEWVPLMTCLNEAGADTVALTACVFLPDAPGFPISASLGGSGGRLATLAVASWMSEVMTTTPFFDVAMIAMKNVLPDSEVHLAMNWSDIGALQFGAGTFTQMLGNNSLNDLGVLPAPFTFPVELYAMGKNKSLDVGPNGAGLTLSQSKAVLSEFTDSQKLFAFLGDLSGPTLLQTLQTWAHVGLFMNFTTMENNIRVFLDYFMHHLPGNTVYNPTILNATGPEAYDEHGLYPSNSGLFSLRTPRDILYGGAPDVVANLLRLPRDDGIIGPNTSFESSQRSAADGTSEPSTRYTGIGDHTLIGNFVSWRGNATVTKRKNCNNEYTKFVAKDPATCYLWKGEEVQVEGAGDLANWPPATSDYSFLTMTEVEADEPIKRGFKSQFGRMLEFERTERVAIHDLETERFVLSKSFMLNDCTNRKDATAECNQDNEKYHMNVGDAVWPLTTVMDGVPVALTFPYFLQPGGVTDVRKCFDLSGLPSGTTQWDLKEHGTWVDVEPVTGKTLSGGGRFQLNYKMDKSHYDHGIFGQVFDAASCDTLIWPVLVAESPVQTATKKDVEPLTELFKTAATFGRAFVFLSIAGIVFMALSCLGGSYFLWRTRKKK